MSYGQDLLLRFLKELIPAQPMEINYRPDWLHGMEIDIFYPLIHLGFEFQGQQHFVPTDRFGDCLSQKYRDKNKKLLCKEMGIRLETVDASELEYTRLRRKLKVCRGSLCGLYPNDKLRIRKSVIKIPYLQNCETLRSLNKESTKYRRTLSESHNDVTVYKKKYNKRKNAVKEAYESYKDNNPNSPSVRQNQREYNIDRWINVIKNSKLKI